MYNEIVEILRLWALDYSQQARVFSNPAMLESEYMSAAQNLINHIPQVVEEERISSIATACALRAYGRVLDLPDFESDESPDEYFNRPDFDIVRHLSREALRAMGEDLRMPNVDLF